MPLYTSLTSLSQTAGSNAADGSADAPSTSDNQLNLLASFIAQLRDAAHVYVGSISGTNTVTGTIASTPTSYTTGQVYQFIVGTTNTGAVTLNFNSIGAKNLYRGSTAMSAGELIAGRVVQVLYDGTQFQLLTPSIGSGAFTAATAGTSIDFTSIPAGVKEITLGLIGVSTNGTSALLAQLGAGSVSASGYVGTATAVQNAAATSISAVSTGFGIVSGAAANAMSGALTFTLIDAATGTWVCSGNVAQSSGSFTNMTAGHKVLSGVLDRVRLTTVGGTDTFDAGNVSIIWK